MKTVLITGAAGGLGACLVRECLDRGWRVFGADLVHGPETEALLAGAGERYVFRTVDITSTAEVNAMAAELSAWTDRLDLLINAAGLFRPETEDLLEDFDIDGSVREFQVNALGPLRVVKACVELLRRGEDRVLVNVSSEAGSMTTNANDIRRYDYAMSKAALNIQSVILQRYLKPDGVKVLVLHPGWMHTPMGGPKAPVDPADAARGILALAEEYRHRPDTWMYWNYNGTERPW